MNIIHTICTSINGSYRWCILFISTLFTSCSLENDLYPYELKDRTLILYMSSDNSLGSIANDLLHRIRGNITPKNSNLLILIDRESTPTLYHLSNNNLKIIKEFQGITSIDPECISQVLSLSKSRFPSIETGLVLWSHGSSWLPSGSRNNTFRSFGYTKGSELDIKKLGKSIGFHYDYIIFDACLMGGIEIYSEFAEKANFILGSPSIIPSSGILSVSAIDTLINNNNPLEKRLKTVCDLYIEGNSTINTDVSLVSTNHLNSFLAHLKPLVEYNRHKKISSSHLKDRYPIRGNIHLYNLEECITEIFPLNDTHILDSMSRFVEYSRSSSSDRYAISVFVPYQNTESYISYYKSLIWNKSTSWISIFSSTQ